MIGCGDEANHLSDWVCLSRLGEANNEDVSLNQVTTKIINDNVRCVLVKIIKGEIEVFLIFHSSLVPFHSYY
jgi:hypothetical protein